MSLPANLHTDLVGETKAIKDYGQRIKQAKGTGISSALSEIQGDEQNHHKKLIKILAGLKAATPKDKE